MNPAWVHLVLNHIPVVAIGVGLLVLAAAMVRNSVEMTRAALGIFVLAALAAIPTYLTGEPAEEVVEHLSGVSESAIHDHEEAAEITMPPTMILGLVSIIGLFLLARRGTAPRWLIVMALAFSVASLGLMARTAHLGGKIQHFEMRGGPAPSGAEAAEGDGD